MSEQNKINELVDNGCIIICATGNFHRRGLDFYPAKYNNVISVAGYDTEGNLDSDSNLWDGISVSMASEQHYFSNTDNQFEHSHGTSSGAAIITGSLACIYSNVKEISKTKAIKAAFSQFSVIGLKSNKPKTKVPKFDINIFLKQINSQL